VEGYYLEGSSRGMVARQARRMFTPRALLPLG
jgi:hypothetical protein